MGSAFDWSPGGCCCAPPWFFDLQTALGRPFSRQCTIYPVGTIIQGLSTLEIGPWTIDLDVSGIAAIAGNNADGYTTWAIGRTNVGGLDHGRLFGLDIASQTRLFTLPDNGIVGTSFNTARNAIKPGPDGIFVVWQPGLPFANSTLNTIDRAGNIVATTIAQQANFLPDGGTEAVLAFANLDWPNALLLASKVVNNVFGNLNEGYWRLEIGQITVAGGGFVFTNKTTIKEIIYSFAAMTNSNGQRVQPSFHDIIGYDNFGGHYGVAYYYDYQPQTNGTYSIKVELVVDGHTIFSLLNPVAGFRYVGPTQNIHACYPHETLGGGYVAVMHKPADTTTGQYEMHVYKNGSLLWKTNSNNKMLGVFGSTDRWIYFGGLPMSEAEFFTMTGGKQRVPQNPGGNPATKSTYFIAKHDGSEIIPFNMALSDTYNFFVDFTNQAPPLGPYVRDSSTVPNSLPATYDEMYAHRHDV